MIGIAKGDQAGLLSHLSRTTCLLIGLSLKDEDLRSLLAQSAFANPGNYHYIVQYRERGQKLSNDYLEAVRQTNFSVYNLITLSLTDEEIAAMGRLLNADEQDLKHRANDAGARICYPFYITGPLGVGKSTAVGNLSGLDIVDEWVESPRERLAVDWRKLTPAERRELDGFVANQFNLKNLQLQKRYVGICLSDRGPLDPLAFTEQELWQEKSNMLLSVICGSRHRVEICPGHVIILTGDYSELTVRLTKSGRSNYAIGDGYDADSLRKMDEDLLKAYGSVGVTRIDTRGRTAADVSHQIAALIHLGTEYVPCNIKERLMQLKSSSSTRSKLIK